MTNDPVTQFEKMVEYAIKALLDAPKTELRHCRVCGRETVHLRFEFKNSEAVRYECTNCRVGRIYG